MQRGTFTFTRIHAHNPPLTPRPGNWLGAAEPCYATHTRTHTQAQAPISLNLTTCLCIRTSSVSPPLGCGVHSEAICLISPASSLPLSLCPSTCLYFFSCMHMHYFPPHSLSLSFYSPLSSYSTTTRLPLSPCSTLPHPTPAPAQARRHHRGVC